MTLEPCYLTFFFTSWTTELCCSVSGSHPVGTLQQGTPTQGKLLDNQTTSPASFHPLLLFYLCGLLLVNEDKK